MDFESFLSSQSQQATAPAAGALNAPDSFESFLTKVKGDQDQRTLDQAQATTVVNAQQGSATAAQAAPVARQLGLPQSAVETDLPRFQQQAKTEANTSLLAQNPVLAKWVAANPDSARIAQDEYSQLSGIERMWADTKGAGYAALQGLGGSFNAAALGVNRQIGAVIGLGGPGAMSNWWQRNMVGTAAADRPAFQLAQDAGIGQKSANLLGNLAGLLSQITLTGGGSAEAIPASAGGLTVLADAAQTAVRSMAFPSLTAATNRGADVFAQTGDQAAATKAAVAEYLFTTAQGLVPFSAPGGILSRAASGAASGFATGEAQREAMNLILPESMQQHFDPQEALFQAMSGAVLGSVMGPRGEPSHMAMIRQTYVDALKAEQAERDIGKVSALGEISAKSKLREADPQAFRNFVETVSENSNLDAVYVDARELAGALAQSKVDLSQAMPELSKQMAEGMATGGDVRIPVADFATHIAGTDLEKALIPNMKAAPDGMTFKEGQAFYQDTSHFMLEKAKEMTARQAETVQADADKQGVYDKVLGDLTATGRFPKHVNEAYASLVREFYATQAERLGMTASELYAKLPLRTVAERIDQPGMDQAEHVTLDTVRQSWDAKGISHSLSEKDGVIELGKIVVPEDARKQGVGTDAMRELAKYADESGQRIELTPSTDFGATSVARLKKFYKQFGFVENKGRSKDFETMAGMYREPAALKQDDAPAGWGKVEAGGGETNMKPGAQSKGLYGPSTNTIALLKNADLSTFLHESGHAFLQMASHIAGEYEAPPQLKADFETLAKWMGAKDAEAWRAMSLEQQRQGHEKFARAFESYLMDGKAPSYELQPLFSRFRSWLLNVYHSLVGLRSTAGQDIEITPEVHEVMDRLLASDKAIKETEQARAYFPLFKTAEEAGMTPEQFKAYVEVGQQASDHALDAMQAKSMADMKWASNAKSRALRELQATASRERKAIREEVTKELSEQPVRQAEAYLKRAGGTDPAPSEANKAWEATRDAQRATLADQVKADLLATPEGAEVKGLKKGQFLAKNKRAMANEVERRLLAWEAQNPRPQRPKVNNDVIAEMFGFTDGKELKKAMDAAGPLGEAVDKLTDARMLERHGELLDPQAVEQAANEAVHNEARARFMATGLKALTKSPLPAAQIAKAAKEAARVAIGMKRVMDLNPRAYLNAETKANKEALASVTKDPQAAIAAQRAAVLSNRLAKAAQDALTEVDRGVRYLKRFDSPDVRAKIDVGYRDQIDALLDRYDLRKKSDAAVERTQSLREFVEAQAAKGLEPNIPEALLNEANRKHYKEMTVDEFRGLLDTVKSIDHLGRLKTKLVDARGERDLAAEVAKVVDSIGKLPPKPPESNRGLTRMEGAWLRAKSAGRSLQASLLKMEQMMDWLDNRQSTGPMNENVFRPIADAGVKEAGMMADVKARIDTFFHSGVADITKDGGKVYVADNLVDSVTGKPARFTKKELLSLAGNMGNASNADKVMRGEGWNERAVWDFLHQNMTKADWDFVAGMGRTLESLWPEKLAMMRRLGNTAPDKIEPRPFDTPHGRYEGWYWPMVYDPARSQDVAERGARSGDALFENTYSRANTDTGRSSTRVQNYARPILLSLDAIPRVIKDEIHDIAFREAVINSDKFLTEPQVRDAIVGALSKEHYDQLKPWLQSIANDGKLDTSNMRALKWFDALAHGARTRATIVGLGYRLSTMLVHGSSAGLESVAELGPTWFGAGLKEFANPTQWVANKDFIFERSGEMRNRMNEVDRDIRDHLREIDLRMMDPATGNIQRGADIVKAHAYQGIAMLDMASALPTWMGAYLKALTPAERGGLAMSEGDAVYFADKTVRNAHGGTGVKDLAAVQRGHEFFKLFTMFYTFWNHNVNRIMDTARMARELPETYRSGDTAKFRGDLGSVIMRTLIYTIGIQSMHGLLHPPKEGDDEESWLKWAGKEFTSSVFAGIPILRDLSAHYLQGKDYSTTPAAAMVDAVGKSGQDAMNAALGENVSDRWLKHTITTAGYAFGLPTGQAASTTQFLWDVAHGYQDPQNLKEWWSGIVHGQAQH